MEFLRIFPLFSFLFLVGSLIARIIYLRKKGIRVSSRAGDKPRILAFVFPVFGLLFLIWLAELSKPAFQLTGLNLPVWFTDKLLNSNILEITGVTVVSVALILWILTLSHFKQSLRFGLDEYNQGALITKGIFSRSRNPFFVSLNLYFTGLAMIQSSPFFILMASLTVVSVHIFIQKEEKFLRKHYGEAYKKYSQRVRRYF